MTERTLPAAPGGAVRWFDCPSVLLVVTGALIGLNFPLGKLGAEAGVAPALWALLIAAGGALALWPVLYVRGALGRPSRRVLRYAAVTALVSFVGPNLLLFTVIPHTGAGYAGLMFALSPVFTVLFAGVCRLRTPGRLGLVGIALGLAGAVTVSLTRGADPAGPGVGWLLLAMLIPVSLAAGNVYRTVDWPPSTSGNVLAFWGQLFSGSILVLWLLATEGRVAVETLAPVGTAALMQMVAAAMSFPVLFRLQQTGGPVLFSQIGYVAAAVGLVVATVFLGERYALLTWLGAALIAVGIGVTVLAQWREKGATALRGPSAAGPESVRA